MSYHCTQLTSLRMIPENTFRSVKWREVEILHNMELKITEEKIEEKPKEVFPRRNSESWKKKRYARLMGRFRRFGRKFG